MAFSPTTILKSLLIKEENTLSPAQIEIVPGGASGTKTTLVGSQTSDSTVTLPASGQLVNDTDLSAVSSVASAAVQSASNIGGATGIFSAKSGTDLEFKTLEAGTGMSFDTTNPSKIILNSTGGGGGANTSLSNLVTTAINQDLRFNAVDAAYQFPSTTVWTIGSSDAVAPLDQNSANHIKLLAGSSNFGAGASVYIQSGNSNSIVWGAAGGNINLQTGTSATSSRGKILFKDGSEGTIGHVWTSTGTSGEGHWQAGLTPGMYAEYYTSTGYLGISPNTWYNLPFDTAVEDANSLYNGTNGVLKIPSGYVGTCRGVVRLYYITNGASGQNGYIKTAMFKGGTNGSGGVFQRYGDILSDYGITDALADKCLYTEFKINGVANDEFYFSIYHNGAPQITGSINASRIEIDIYPK